MAEIASMTMLERMRIEMEDPKSITKSLRERELI
jgi:hypothetical protein